MSLFTRYRPLSSTWEERARERRFARPTPRAASSPHPAFDGNSVSATAPGARVGSFDTDAFGVLLRMKLSVCQYLTNSFMLSSQPQAGVSKHPTRLLLPGCRRLAQTATLDPIAGCGRAQPLTRTRRR